jgi:FkbM family methyltransferase
MLLTVQRARDTLYDKIARNYRRIPTRRERCATAVVAWVNRVQPTAEFRFLDVGALGGLSDLAFPAVKALHRLHLVGIEPDVEAARNLVADPVAGYCRVEAVAVAGTAGKRELHLTELRGCSSLAKTVPGIHRRMERGWFFNPDGSIPVEVTTLDALFPTERFDFIKLDIQGVEHDVLRSAGSVLDDAQGVYVEVHFQPIYENEQTFPAIHEELLRRGFHLVCFDEESGLFDGVLLEANCVYMKRPESIHDRLTLIRQIVIAAICLDPAYVNFLLREFSDGHLTAREILGLRRKAQLPIPAPRRATCGP